jgi:hypothetical protein
MQKNIHIKREKITNLNLFNTVKNDKYKRILSECMPNEIVKLLILVHKN